jgi:hypothetical protein
MLRRLGLTVALSTLTLVAAVLFGSDVAHSQAAEPDMSKLSLVFREDFDDGLNVSPWGPNTRWIAHTPWHGDFGDAQFADPMLGFPFTVVDGMLRIEARKDSDGKWKSACYLQPTRMAEVSRCSTVTSKCARSCRQDPACGPRFGWAP